METSLALWRTLPHTQRILKFSHPTRLHASVPSPRQRNPAHASAELVSCTSVYEISDFSSHAETTYSKRSNDLSTSPAVPDERMPDPSPRLPEPSASRRADEGNDATSQTEGNMAGADSGPRSRVPSFDTNPRGPLQTGQHPAYPAEERPLPRMLNPNKMWTPEQHAAALQVVMHSLPQLGEPLRTCISQVPFVSIFPAQWFAIALNPVYTPHCRTFAQLVGAEAPKVLNAFLLADFNVIYRDREATAGHSKSLLRIRYGIKVIHLIKLMRGTSVVQILRNPTLRANRRKTWADT